MAEANSDFTTSGSSSHSDFTTTPAPITAPTVTLDYPTDELTGLTPGLYTFTGTVTDDGAINSFVLEVRNLDSGQFWNGSVYATTGLAYPTITGNTWSSVVELTDNATFSARAIAVDDDNQTSESALITFATGVPSIDDPVIVTDPYNGGNLAPAIPGAPVRVLFGDLRSGKILGEVPVTACTWTDVYNGAGSITVTTPLINPNPSLVVDEGNTTLWVEEYGQLVKGFIVWATAPDDRTVTLAGEGMHSYVRKRHILADVSYSDDQATIAKELVNRVAGDCRVTTEGAPTGVSRVRNFAKEDAKNIGEALEQLAAVSNGIDFRYVAHRDANGLASSRFIVDYPATGRETDLELVHGERGVELSGVQTDATGLANTSVGIGAANGSATPFAVVTDDEALGGYAPLETVESYPNVITEGTVLEHAELNLKRTRQKMRRATATYFGPARGEAIGDQCRATYNRGIVSFSAKCRIVSVSVDYDTGVRRTALDLAPLEAFL